MDVNDMTSFPSIVHNFEGEISAAPPINRLILLTLTRGPLTVTLVF